LRTNEQENFKSFISPQQHPKELTPGSLLVGIILGIVFGASSLYLALKVGMTVSASIPIAVLSITIFRMISQVFGRKNATILQNNIVQTTGSAGETIAFGISATIPALLILGFDMDLGRTMIVASLGGLLGVLMMIPLRHALMVKGHKELTYPEGTACAEVLVVGEKGGMSAKTVFSGFFFGLIYKFLNVGGKLWNDVPERALGFFKGATLTAEVSPELLGVGYIIGPRVAFVTVAGGLLSTWVLVPAIRLFGDGLTTPLFPGTKPISQMTGHEIWSSYILYIGAGCVAAGGLISLFRSLPTIIKSAAAGLGGFRDPGAKMRAFIRTERDIPLKYVFGGVGFTVLAIWLIPILHMNLVGAILIVVAGFLFVTVSSRITGEIGSSSNPISGMTVATLLFTSLLFLLLGWTSLQDRVVALSIAAIVAVAIANAGGTSQDLKTGFLVGATPRAQQIAILIGSLTSALVIGYTLNLLNDASTVYSKKSLPAGVHIRDVSSLTEMQKLTGPEAKKDSKSYHVLWVRHEGGVGLNAELQPGKYLVDDGGAVRYFVDPGINGRLKERDDGSQVFKYEAPKARLMSMIIDGILKQQLPWGLVLLGIAIAIVLELCGVSALPFAVGVYLPLSTTSPIFFGGLVRWFVNRVSKRRKASDAELESSPGILYSSGLIAGGSIAGILLAFLSLQPEWMERMAIGSKTSWLVENDLSAVLAFFLMMLILYKVGTDRTKMKMVD